MALPTFNTAPKYVVTAVNPITGAVAVETFNDGDYIDWGSVVCNDEQKMNEHVRYLVRNDYPVVVTQSKLDYDGLIDYQVMINIHPNSIYCDCGKGILCPLNTQQVNIYKGKVVTKDMAAN